MNTTAIQDAVAIAGSQSELARRIGISQGHLWSWLHRDKKVPAERCAAIERATNGAVSRYALRPDVFGPAPDPDA